MRFKSFIKNNLLLKVTAANSLVVFVRMFCSLLSQKVLAVLIGAEGIALVGNLKNVIGFFEQFSILGTFNGLVKYISEHKTNPKELHNIFSTSFVFTAVASIISFVVLFFGADILNQIIFGIDNNYVFIFKVLAFFVPFMGLNANLNSLLNGLSAFKVYAKVSIVTVIVSTGLIIALTYKYSIVGSLLAISLIPIIQVLSYLVCLSKEYLKKINLKSLSFSLIFKNRLLSYSFMTLIVVLLINLVEVAIRNLIEHTISINDAGYWTAMTSISRTYMHFSAALFPLYILPKYAKIKSSFEFRKEVIDIYKLLLPVFAIGLVLIYIFKNTIIQILYTEDFLSMSNLFKWQLLGDLIKLSALVISYQFLAKRQIGYFIFTEILSVVLFYGFSKYFIQFYGTEGIVMAHFARYIIYFLVVLYILRHNFIGKDRIL